MDIKKILFAGLLSAASLSAFAGEHYWAIQALLGGGTQDIKSSAFEEDSVVIGFRGSFVLNRYLGFEAGLMGFSEEKSKDAGFESALSSVDIGVKGMIPVTEQVSLYGRLGLASWVQQTTYEHDGLGEVSYDAIGEDFYYGLGAQYVIADKFTVGLEYTLANLDGEYDDDDIDGDIEIDITVLALTAGMRF